MYIAVEVVVVSEAILTAATVRVVATFVCVPASSVGNTYYKWLTESTKNSFSWKNFKMGKKDNFYEVKQTESANSIKN